MNTANAVYGLIGSAVLFYVLGKLFTLFRLLRGLPSLTQCVFVQSALPSSFSFGIFRKSL
jgi:hypothetical protein